MPLLLFGIGSAAAVVDTARATRFGLSGGIARPLDISLFGNKEVGVIIPIVDPVPSGNRRKLRFTANNRSLSFTKTNRKMRLS